jgi:hypothetical protein
MAIGKTAVTEEDMTEEDGRAEEAAIAGEIMI